MPGWLRAQGSQVLLALATGTSYLICECYYCYCLEVRKSATGLIFLLLIYGCKGDGPRQLSPVRTPRVTNSLPNIASIHLTDAYRLRKRVPVCKTRQTLPL